MTFTQLFSNSDGNAYIVTANNGKRLLIECGVSWPRLQKALGYDLDGIVACILSHSHKDHSKAVKDVLRAGIDVYASQGTFDALGLTNERRANVVANKQVVRDLGPFEVFPFDTEHDAPEPLGFVVREKSGAYTYAIVRMPLDEHLLFVTDTFHIKQKFKIPFNIIAIECSYNGEYLKKRVDNNDINEHLAKRLLESHMELETTMSYLTECCNLSKCQQLHLIHLSQDNIEAEKVRARFEKELFIETIIHGKP